MPTVPPATPSLPLRAWRRARAALLRRRLARRWPGYDWDRFSAVAAAFPGDAMATPEERAFLFRIASDLPPGAVVIELGSWVGVSTCALAAALRGPGALVHAVDTFQGLVRAEAGPGGDDPRFDHAGLPVGEAFRETVRGLGLEERIRILACSPAEALTRIGLPAGTAHCVFFHGDHSYEGCRDEIARWLPLLAPRGIAAFHDFGTHEEVSRAVFEAIATGRFRDVVGQKDSLIALRV